MESSQASTRIPAEYRFPLHLEPSLATVWNLYSASKQDIWDPAADFAWERFSSADYSHEALTAARLVWSHRVWWFYGRLTETPALLVRFCLERQRESDPKYFLSMRGSEDAWHVDACQRMAAALGGLFDAPDDTGYAARFNIALHRHALDAERSLDSYVVAYVAFRDGLEADLLRAAEQCAGDPLVKALLARLWTDRERQSEFGWLYLRERASAWVLCEREEIAARLVECQARLLASGIMLPALGDAPASLRAAYELAAAAGLGGLSVEDARATLSRYRSRARERLAVLQIKLDDALDIS